MGKTFAIGIGGAAGQGVATPGDISPRFSVAGVCISMPITRTSRSSEVDTRFSRFAPGRKESPTWATGWIC